MTAVENIDTNKDVTRKVKERLNFISTPFVKKSILLYPIDLNKLVISLSIFSVTVEMRCPQI